MSSFKKTCEQYFGTSNLYEILEIQPDATKKQIKKAYHKISLLVHPDRVEASEKETATEKFKVLGRIHSILEDSDQRKSYDEHGEVDDDNDSGFNWMEYWQAIFRPIKIEDIDQHKKEYVGSETELRDIKKAYLGCNGDMGLILEMVPFSNCDDEPRILEAIRKMIDDGEVDEIPGLFDETKKKKNLRRKKWQDEEKLSEQIDMKSLEEEMRRNREKSSRQFSDLISGLEKKYGSGSKRKSLTSGREERTNKRTTRSSKN